MVRYAGGASVVLFEVMRSQMFTIFLGLMAFVLLGAPFSARSGEKDYQIYHQKYFGREKLQQKYQDIQKSLDKSELQKIFSKEKRGCGPDVISALDDLDDGDIKFAIVYAHQNQWLDEVETDILMSYAQTYEDVHWRGLQDEFRRHGFRLRSGRETLKNLYQKLFSDNGFEQTCLTTRYESFDEEMFSITQGKKHQKNMEFFNYYARRYGFITKKQYYLAEMMRKVKSRGSLPLTMKEYWEKRETLQNKGFQINSEITSFHINKRAENENSLRTKVYSTYTPLQIEEMLNLLGRMNKRSGAKGAKITFSYGEDERVENIELSHTEKLRASMKLYKREKRELLSKSFFKGGDFSYRQLVALSFEMSKIDLIDLHYLSELERKTREEGFLEKAFDHAQRYGSIATLIGGPTVGFVYTLAVTFADRIINGPDKKQKAEYEHGIFYGGCEEGL